MVKFGPYALHQRLAVGGMAEVFLATRRNAGPEPLVIKRILPRLETQANFVQMFLDEARLGSSLLHPNLVEIYDFGRADGAHFIAMEYVDGVTLSELIKRMGGKPLPQNVITYIAAEACEGLSYAHNFRDAKGTSLGIVHRDISPDNILFAMSGQVKLFDFGIAKNAAGVARTEPGQLKGKISYMSPEQAMGAPIDRRSDIFSLGAVLYEMSTGQQAFRGPNDAAVLRALMKVEFPPPQAIVGDYPEDLAQIVMKAMAWDPAHRFQSAGEFQATLIQRGIDRSDAMSHLSSLVQWAFSEEVVQSVVVEPDWVDSQLTPRGKTVTMGLVAAERSATEKINGEDREVPFFSATEKTVEGDRPPADDSQLLTHLVQGSKATTDNDEEAPTPAFWQEEAIALGRSESLRAGLERRPSLWTWVVLALAMVAGMGVALALRFADIL